MIWTLISCQSHENKIIKHHQQYPQHFDELVNAIYNDPILLNQRNKLIQYGDLDDRTKKALQQLDLPEINYVTLGGIRCQEANEIEIEIIYNGSWHLQYEPCRKGNFTTGKYSEIGFIESWEIDRNWYVWVNNDLIG